MGDDKVATLASVRRRITQLLVGLFALVAVRSAQAQQPETMRVNSDRVNLRVAPSVDSGVVRALGAGTLVVVISRDGGWTKVQLKGQATLGWIRSSLLVAVPSGVPAPAAPATTAPPVAPAAPAPSDAAPPPAKRIGPPPPPAASPAPQGSGNPPGYKDPGMATLFSVLITGGGQIYAGDTGRGFLLMGGGVGAVIIGCGVSGSLSACELGLVVDLGVYVYAIVDAAPTARRMNARNGVKVAVIPLVLPSAQPRFGVAIHVQM